MTAAPTSAPPGVDLPPDADHHETATDALRRALDRAEAALGRAELVERLADRYGPQVRAPQFRDSSYDDLRAIAVLAHDGHDPFRSEHCQRELCREIAHLIGTRG